MSSLSLASQLLQKPQYEQVQRWTALRTDAVLAMAVSPDGVTLCAATRAGRLHLWECVYRGGRRDRDAPSEQ